MRDSANSQLLNRKSENHFMWVKTSVAGLFNYFLVTKVFFWVVQLMNM